MMLLQSNLTYQHSLAKHFNPDNLTPLACPSKQSYHEARYKMRASAFETASDLLLEKFYLNNKSLKKSFCGKRLLVIDGSGARLEDRAYKEMLEELKEQGTTVVESVSKPQAPIIRASFLHDVDTELVIDIKAVANTFSEEELALEHCSKVGESDVLLFDRGYHALWFLAALNRKGKHFICRGKSQNYTNKFLASGLEEDIIDVPVKASNLNTASRHKELIKEVGIKAGEVLKLRLIRYEELNEHGEPVTYVMVTNLLDKEKYPKEEFKPAYALRWRVEEGIKTHKISCELERWTGCTWQSAQQDIKSNILFYNLTRMASYDTDQTIREQSKREFDLNEYKYCKKLSITEALRAFRSMMSNLGRSLLNFDTLSHVRGFCETITKYIVDIRPGRSFSRKVKNSAKKFHMNCKSNT